jgi:hypothetical protein
VRRRIHVSVTDLVNPAPVSDYDGAPTGKE